MNIRKLTVLEKVECLLYLISDLCERDAEYLPRFDEDGEPFWTRLVRTYGSLIEVMSVEILEREVRQSQYLEEFDFPGGGGFYFSDKPPYLIVSQKLHGTLRRDYKTFWDDLNKAALQISYWKRKQKPVKNLARLPINPQAGMAPA